MNEETNAPMTTEPAPSIAETPTAAALTPAQLEQLALQATKAAEHWERFVRVTADFDNFKKRAAKERQDAVRFANVALIEKLVPVLDNFDMALAATSAEANAAVDSLKTGVAMIAGQLKNVLLEAGLEEINATNQPFDPNWHEAVAQQDSAEVAEGHVLLQLRKGYKLRERLLRPAGVVVARKAATV